MTSDNLEPTLDALIDDKDTRDKLADSDAEDRIEDAVNEITGGPGIVSPPNNDEVVNNHTGERYSDISAAVDDADTYDTLIVGPGTYEGSVKIDVEGLTLEGPNAGTAYDGTRDNEAEIDGEVLIQEAEVTVDGFRFDDVDVSYTISIEEGGDDASVRNSIFRIEDSDRNREIKVAGAQGVSVVGNEFDGSDDDEGIGGPWFWDGDVGDVEMTSNKVDSAYGEALQISSGVDSVGSVTIEDNEVVGTDSFADVEIGTEPDAGSTVNGIDVNDNEGDIANEILEDNDIDDVALWDDDTYDDE